MPPARPTLAERSGIAHEALSLAWSEGRTGGMPAHDLTAVRTTLERAGVRFGLDADGRPIAAPAADP